MKRFEPRAFGRSMPILKRSTNVKVILEEREEGKNRTEVNKKARNRDYQGCGSNGRRIVAKEEKKKARNRSMIGRKKRSQRRLCVLSKRYFRERLLK
jgi:hypothetical protein